MGTFDIQLGYLNFKIKYKCNIFIWLFKKKTNIYIFDGCPKKMISAQHWSKHE